MAAGPHLQRLSRFRYPGSQPALGPGSPARALRSLCTLMLAPCRTGRRALLRRWRRASLGARARGRAHRGWDFLQRERLIHAAWGPQRPRAHRGALVDVRHELRQEAVVPLQRVDAVECAEDRLAAARLRARGHVRLVDDGDQVALQRKVLACACAWAPAWAPRQAPPAPGPAGRDRLQHALPLCVPCGFCLPGPAQPAAVKSALQGARRLGAWRRAAVAGTPRWRARWGCGRAGWLGQGVGSRAGSVPS